MNGTCVICGKYSDTNELVLIDGGFWRVCAGCREKVAKGGQKYAEKVAEDREEMENLREIWEEIGGSND